MRSPYVEQIIGREGETAAFFSRYLLNPELRVFGFAPRQLRRSAAILSGEVKIMKRVFIIIVLLAMFQLALGQSKSKDESRNSKAEQELLQLENQLFEATKKHDVAFFQRILADDYIFTSSGATVADKPDTIKWFSTPVEPETTLEMSDLKVRVYGIQALPPEYRKHLGRQTE